MKMRRVCVVTIALLLAMTSCASDSSTAGSQLGQLLGVSDAQSIDEAIFVSVNERSQDAVRECMAQAGFEYRVQPDAATYRRAGDDGTLSDEQYAAEFGFGVYVSLSGDRELPATGTDQSVNSDYISSLSDGEREAWYDQVDGCTRDSWDLEDRLYELVTPFDDAAQVLEQRVMNDPTVIAAEATWASCMAVEGFVYRSRSQMVDDLLSEGNRIASSAEQTVTAGLPRNMDSPEGEAFKQHELAVATLDYKCAQDLQSTIIAVRRVQEAALIEADPALSRAAIDFRDES